MYHLKKKIIRKEVLSAGTKKVMKHTFLLTGKGVEVTIYEPPQFQGLPHRCMLLLIHGCSVYTSFHVVSVHP